MAIYHHATIWSVTIPFRWGCVPHGYSLPSHSIEVVRIMAIYHHATTWGVTILSRGIAPSMAGAHARKGAGEVTPKGLYFRQGRVDERSEIYPV